MTTTDTTGPMTDLDDLDQLAETTARRAFEARAARDADVARKLAERDDAERTLALERCRAFDHKALRRDVRDAGARLAEQLRTDPLGAALVDYLTAVMRERHERAEAPHLAAQAGVDRSALGIPDVSNETNGEPWRAASGAQITDLHAAAVTTLAALVVEAATANLDDEHLAREQAREETLAGLPKPAEAGVVEAAQLEREQQHQAYLADLAANGVTGPLSVPYEDMTASHRQSLGYPSTKRPTNDPRTTN